MKRFFFVIAMVLLPSFATVQAASPKSRLIVMADMGSEPDEEQQIRAVGQWDCFETSLRVSKTYGDPFGDVALAASSTSPTLLIMGNNNCMLLSPSLARNMARNCTRNISG